MLDRTNGQPSALEEEAATLPRRPMGVAPFYLAVVSQIHTRIRRLGIPMWKCDDLSGLQDGYTAKLLHPDAPSGRQARWDTLQLLIDAVYPDGYEVIIRPRDAAKAAKLEPSSNEVVDARVRSIMAMMGRKGGLRSKEVRRARMKAAQ